MSYEECRDREYRQLQQCVREVLRSDVRRPGDQGACYEKHRKAEERCEKYEREGPPGPPFSRRS